MHTIRNAWDIVSSKTISNCYKKCGLNIADEAENFTEEIIIDEEGMDETFLRYVSIDDNLQTSGEKFDSKIQQTSYILKLCQTKKWRNRSRRMKKSQCQTCPLQ
ncbi:hypothetical protein AVEN_172639-1 [Araneus ventricosus]|uniref:DDE-1 domain-containing protein n=1 Tax=Araneus ventricosus TaxID=182803 RepID=A0A4Y2NEB6_ARAVE|nr:hypothetical protein AVEN_172639-1 [Araneus ventricosus]